MKKIIEFKWKMIPFKIILIYLLFGILLVLSVDNSIFLVLSCALLYILIRSLTDMAARSEARQQLLLDSISEEVYLYEGLGADGLPGKFLEVNEQACVRLGYAREEFLKMCPSAIDDPSSLPNMLNLMQRLRKDGRVVWEGAHLTKWGRSIPVQISSRFFQMNGKECILSICIDITRRKQVENAFLRQKELLETASRSARVALWEWDIPNGTLAWSDIIDPMLGYSEREFLRSHSAWQESLHAEDKPRVLAALEAHLNENVPYALEYRMKKKDGAYIWWADRGTCRRDAQGKVYQMSGACVDITDRKLAEEAHEKERAQAQRYLDVAGVMFIALDKEGRVALINKKGCEILGYTEQEIIGREWFELCLLPGEAQKTREIFQRLAGGDMLFGEHHENRIVTKSGEVRDIAFNNTILFEQGTRFSGVLSSGEDITEHKRAEEALAKEHMLLRTLIDNLPDAVYVKDTLGRKILTNRSDLEFMGGRSESDVIGKTDAEIYPHYLAEQFLKDDETVLRDGSPVINREEFIEDSKGSKRWVLTSKIPLKDQAGNQTGLVGIGRDITDRKSMESKLFTMAHYDTLTSLPNRTLFRERANMSLAHASRSGRHCAVLFVDLDHFKSINDTLGHSVGDELLKDTALKLTECIRGRDTLARLGGDEFIILLNDLEDAQGAQFAAERIREKLNVPRMVAGNDLFVTASVGISTYPCDGDTLEDLLKNADTAMYAAKEGGRNNFCFFNDVMNKKVVVKMQVERGLRDALAKNELVLFYQPIVGIADGSVRGFEALLRWFKVDGGLVLPDDFIPVAEETGLIVPIGEWVLREACFFNKKMIDAGYGNLIMSVNISVVQLRRKNLVESIKAALDESGLPPQLLEVEITESMLIASFEAAIDVLNSIRSLGVRVSLDDFGTGYSSLVHLQRLPIANLKIDRIFIKQIVEEGTENALIPLIIDLAHKLNLSVVAEGVETNLQFDKLSGNNCDFFQGYLFSKPMPEAQVIPFLEGMRRGH